MDVYMCPPSLPGEQFSPVIALTLPDFQDTETSLPTSELLNLISPGLDN